MWFLLPVLLIAVFILNFITHGKIPHPGKAEYMDSCAQCHGDDGEGIQTLVPPLEQSNLSEINIDSIPCWIKFGINHPVLVNGVSYDQPMYPIQLTDIQIANVLNYINSQFLHTDKTVSSKWVKERLENCQ
jgi:mono/diheme cytochrome c family protein